MTGVLTSTATSGTRKTVLTLLAALSLLAAAAIVYAATAKSDFKVSAAPASRTLTPGGAATYNVKIKRIKGFSGSVKLSISNLPGGTTATWKAAKPACKRGKHCPKPKANIVAPGASSAVLTLKTSSGTPVGAAKPTITGASGHLKHTAPITLNLAAPAQTGSNTGGNPGNTGGNTGNPGTPNTPAESFAVSDTPASQNVLQGDQTSFTVNIDRSGGFTGPVSFGVSGLPTDATATFAPASTVSGNGATMTVNTATTTPAGSYPLTITGSGGGASHTAPATLVVQQTVPYTISGDLGTSLSPGSSAPLNLTLHNPYSFDLKIDDLNVALTEPAVSDGCQRSANYALAQIPSNDFPITLSAGQTQTLSQLGIASADQPQVAMNDLPTDQDACKGAAVNFTYSTVSAHK